MAIFSIFAWIDLWVWLTGSGSSGFNWGQDWDWWADGWARALGLAPPVWMGCHWGPSEGGGCKDSSGTGPGASHSSEKPSTKKMARPGGNVGSQLRSPSTSNLTCFFGFLADVGASLQWTLLLDFWGLVYKFRFFIEWLSCSATGWDCGRLGEGDWHLLRKWGEGFWCHLKLSLPIEQGVPSQLWLSHRGVFFQ